MKAWQSIVFHIYARKLRNAMPYPKNQDSRADHCRFHMRRKRPDITTSGQKLPIPS